jgi:AraC-like DNA-binding protein
LEKAMEQLLGKPSGVSIKTIALACGYRHMGLFSGDFKRRFGVSPSAVPAGGGGGVILVFYYAIPWPARAPRHGDGAAQQAPFPRLVDRLLGTRGDLRHRPHGDAVGCGRIQAALSGVSGGPGRLGG